jgi:hypothetical protein
MASACPHAASPPPALELANPSVAFEIPVPSLISQNLPLPLGISPVHRKERGGEGEKEKLEERRTGSRTGGARSRRAAGPPGRRPACRRGRLRKGRPCMDRKGAGAVQAADDRLYFLFAELNPCFLCPSTRSTSGFAATAPPPSLPRRPSLRPVVTEVSTIPSPCCGPNLRAEAGQSLVSSLFVCCPLPARAAAQTRHRLRAEPSRSLAGAAAVIAARAPLPCDRADPLFRRVSPSFGLPPAPTRLSTRHPAKALPFLGQESCEHKPPSCALPCLPSTCLCPIVVRMLSALRHRHGCAADVFPAHTTTGLRPCSSWSNLCTRTHTHASSFVGVCA